MNKKGQTLIIFVILIPVMITMCALVVDIGYLTHQNEKIKGIVDDSIHEYYAKGLVATKELLNLNEIEEKDYKITEKDNQIEILVEKNIESIFGKIININEYAIKINRVGKKENNKVLIEKKVG